MTKHHSKSNRRAEKSKASVPQINHADREEDGAYDNNANQGYEFVHDPPSDEQPLDRYLDESQTRQGPYHVDKSGIAEKTPRQYRKDMKEYLKALAVEEKLDKKNVENGSSSGSKKSMTRPR